MRLFNEYKPNPPYHISPSALPNAEVIYGCSLPPEDDDDDDDSSIEGEVLGMELQLEKISNGVIEITEKMDSWLRYSKKNLAKSDANTDALTGNIKATDESVNALKVRTDL